MAAAPSPGTARRCAGRRACGPELADNARDRKWCVPPEVTLMFPDDLFAAADDDPVRIGAHLHRPARRPGHDRVAVAVEADEAGAGNGMLALMETVEGRQDRLKDRPLHLQRLGHGYIAALGMGVMLGPAPALSLEPSVELGQAREPKPGLEEARPDRLYLLLDLPFPIPPPACRRSVRPCNDRS